MSSSLFIFLVSAAIVALLVGRAFIVVKREAGEKQRGSEPGSGHHTIHAEYSSGFSGHSTSYKIPRDPEAYARRFVPQSSREKK
ncbi:MAG: hypothetical protein AAGF13_03610 [Pseudomonadota bacterium]